MDFLLLQYLSSRPTSPQGRLYVPIWGKEENVPYDIVVYWLLTARAALFLSRASGTSATIVGGNTVLRLLVESIMETWCSTEDGE